MPDRARVDLARERLARFLAGEMDDPGYEPEDLLMRDVWCLEEEDGAWLIAEIARALRGPGADPRSGWLVIHAVRSPERRAELEALYRRIRDGQG